MPRRWKLGSFRICEDEGQGIVINERMSIELCIEDRLLLRFWQCERPSEECLSLASGLDPSGATCLVVA